MAKISTEMDGEAMPFLKLLDSILFFYGIKLSNFPATKALLLLKIFTSILMAATWAIIINHNVAIFKAPSISIVVFLRVMPLWVCFCGTVTYCMALRRYKKLATLIASILKMLQQALPPSEFRGMMRKLRRNTATVVLALLAFWFGYLLCNCIRILQMPKVESLEVHDVIDVKTNFGRNSSVYLVAVSMYLVIEIFTSIWLIVYCISCVLLHRLFVNYLPTKALNIGDGRAEICKTLAKLLLRHHRACGFLKLDNEIFTETAFLWTLRFIVIMGFDIRLLFTSSLYSVLDAMHGISNGIFFISLMGFSMRINDQVCNSLQYVKNCINALLSTYDEDSEEEDKNMENSIILQISILYTTCFKNHFAAVTGWGIFKFNRNATLAYIGAMVTYATLLLDLH